MRHRSSPSKKGRKILLLIITLMIISGFYLYSRYDYQIKTPVNPENTDTIAITIKKGDSLATLSQQLTEKNLIWDANSFKLYTKLNNVDTKLIPGRYLLNQGQNVPEIITVITNPEKRQIVVTVPEGATVLEIDKKLTDLEIIKAGEFAETVANFKNFDTYPFLNHLKNRKLHYSLEGYLFPDTYFLDPQDFSSEKLISMMLNNFQKKLSSLKIHNAAHNQEQIVIVASMIEKEANKDPDRPLIADIIWRRLNENWQLGIDATLLYLKTDRTIDYNTLKEKSPYNTRLFTDLPPGPISNPGLKSLEAAVKPESNEYYYYLTGRDGKMYYGKTLEEHNRNKARYL